ncbi:prolyl oligopeptidase family serine peptidase [Ottowia thiooxydans]|uniref:Prolyl oligopeptidase n=1 Tax=Ottowia thiooxydans TaxID=219182 RepID=A0ABV2QH65_9BURK
MSQNLSHPVLEPDGAPIDPYDWLEDVQGERSLAWVRERNAASQSELAARPEYESTRVQLLEVMNAQDRIPWVSRRGDWLYNFWQDEQHKRGIWRRTTLAEYRKPQPVWETVLDIDALNQAEGENWVWGGADCLAPDYRRCLLQLSRGGADATVVREFDTVSKEFVQDGFNLPEAKLSIEWADDNTVYVATDFGPGSLTDAGYPRVIKRWERGTPVLAAVVVFEGEPQDVSVSVRVDRTPGFERTIFSRALDFYNTRAFLLDSVSGAMVALDIPSDASPDFMRETLLLQLRSPMPVGDKTFPAGSLLHADAAAYLRGERVLQALFTPTATRSLAGYTATRNHLLLNVIDNVAGTLEQWRKDGHTFFRREIDAPFPGTLDVSGLYDPLLEDDPLAEAYWLTYTDFLTPESLHLATTVHDERELLKSRGAQFDSSGMKAEQYFAKSSDGTAVPYFVVWPKGATANGRNPTLLYGYGGFEVSLQPWYSGAYGQAWYPHGGVLVVANIRGGGEYGPGWHQSAVKASKQRSFDDFIAVAEDLVRRQITSPRHLGIMGGSNGGLLVGAALTQRPDLFNAVVCQVPLLDMRRYHTLLAGASWMSEYGNPDLSAEWAYISKYSPYQNVKPGVAYPSVFFTTSTRDDRVHPAHARKMAARMLEQKHDVLYYENMEGGHGGAADHEQRAHLQALEFSYLWRQLG